MDVKLVGHISKGSTYGIIPARGGSKGIPQKNIRMIAGHPLIAYSIASCRLAKKIGRVIVSTDSPEIAQIALLYGAEVPFLRPAEFARDDSPDLEFVLHALGWLHENEGYLPEYLVHMRPTTPIRDPKVVDDAIDVFSLDGEATSLRSGSLCAHPPYKWLARRKGEKYTGPLFPNMTCDELNLPRQDFPEVYMPNGYVDVLRTEFIIRSNLMHGDKMIGYVTPQVPDVDTEDDLCRLTVFPSHQEQFLMLKNYLDSIVRRSDK